MANVLIIDDDVQVTRMLESFLKEEGHAVRVAHQGDQGVQEALAQKPDLIFLDVMLPDATGFQLCSRLRENASLHDVPIFMMTGVAKNDSQRGFAMERGANEYLHKPFEVIEVGDLVRSYIRGDKKVHRHPISEINPVLAKPAIRRQQPGDLMELQAFLQQALRRAN
jgi:DNA-binding response OmpR family regulator